METPAASNVLPEADVFRGANTLNETILQLLGFSSEYFRLTHPPYQQRYGLTGAGHFGNVHAQRFPSFVSIELTDKLTEQARSTDFTIFTRAGDVNPTAGGIKKNTIQYSGPTANGLIRRCVDTPDALFYSKEYLERIAELIKSGAVTISG